jgi:hypothetical protein
MDITISQETFKKLDASIDQYLKNIGDSIYNENLINAEKISKDKFIETFTESRKIENYKHIPNKHNIPDEERCIGKVWKHVEKEYVQCNKRKLEHQRFCKLHLKKRNYGEITK